MRARTLLLMLLAWLASPATLSAAETVVYVSVKDERLIRSFRMADDGSLTSGDTTVLDGEPAGLTTDSKRRFLFASIRSDGRLASFRIDPKSGRLTALGSIMAAADPAYLFVDRSDRFLLTAYYQAGSVAVHRIGDDGRLEPQGRWYPTADKAHAILTDRSNRYAYVPHTGPNVIFQFNFDATQGRLSPLQDAARIPGATNPAGPRHVVFHQSLPYAYCVNEQGSSVSLFRMRAGRGGLMPGPTWSTLPADFHGRNACADLELSPDGRHLYASNRGHDSLAVFRVQEDGQLISLGQVPTEPTPRQFNIEPGGRFLYAAGQSSGRLAAFQVDPSTGSLTRFATYTVGRQPWWVMSLRLGE